MTDFKEVGKRREKEGSEYRMSLPYMTGVRMFLFLFFLLPFVQGHSQPADSTGLPFSLSGKVSLTNNGISAIPSFSLGKPAGILDLSMGKKWRIEPQFRFSLDGKPWSFLCWFRYPLVQKGKFSLRVGAHPSLIFKTITVTSGTQTEDVIRAQRFLGMEIAPGIAFSEHFRAGLYYLNARGLEANSTRNTHYFTINGSLTNLRIAGSYVLNFSPQVFYLNADHTGGYYVSASLELKNTHLPVSLTAMMNKDLRTDFPVDEPLLWSVSLVYSFDKKYRDF